MSLNHCYIGDCRDTMRKLIAQGVKVQMCVTSPPYFGLRDYGHPGQLGLEATPAEYVAAMVEVFALVRELLADDGVLWLNLGDSYANDAKWGGSSGGKHVKALHGDTNIGRGKKATGLKPKDLIGIPWRVAFALQEAGWYLRQDIIWHKPNPMPESVTDRCTKAHEYLFLLSKNERYYFDNKAIAEPVAKSTIERLSQPTLDQQHVSDRIPGKTNGTMKAVPPSWMGSSFDRGKTGEMMQTRGGLKKSGNKERKPGSARGCPKGSASNVCGSVPWEGSMRNKRSVWTVPTMPYKGAHFATFPPALIVPCILAGSRHGDVVLDPFFGSGTTGQVAQQLGRQWIGCELNQDYAPLQNERICQQGMVLA